MNKPLIAKSTQPTPLPGKGTKTVRVLWADCVPLPWKPYVQLTRIDLFAGSLMIFWPYVWTLGLIRKEMNLSQYISLLPQVSTWLAWSILLHSVGSTWNDICDIDFDRQVERTKNRPLPSGTISIRAAFLWMFPQIAILLAILLQYNPFTLYMGMVQIFLLTPIYPFTKRYFHIPQAWLGITIAWGAVVSWVANADVHWPTISLLVASITIWVTYIDTFYAMLDKKDDPKAEVKSSALLFGNHARPILAALAILFVAGMAGTGYLTKANPFFYIISILGAVLHFGWQLITVDFDDSALCMVMFNSNLKTLGGLIWAGALLG